MACCLMISDGTANKPLPETILAKEYHKISNISCTKSQNLNDSPLVLQLFLPYPLNSQVQNQIW